MRNIRSEKISEIGGLRVDLLNRNDVTMVLQAHHDHLVDATGSMDHHPYSIVDDAIILLHLLRPQRC